MKHYWIVLLAAFMLLGGFILGSAGSAQAADAIQLRYDDRKELSALLGVTVESVTISNEQVTSKSVGTNTPDAHVLQYENGTLYATGTGSATLTVNGKDYTPFNAKDMYCVEVADINPQELADVLPASLYAPEQLK